MTTDALACQREIARKVIEGGDDALALKGNQGALRDDVRRFLDDPKRGASVSKPMINADHGRIDPDGHGLRRCRLAAGRPCLARPPSAKSSAPGKPQAR